ncbi:MAG: flagellar hook-associated protein FlgK [Fimbriimonadaceae bacterium]|nr:flagellar hook-associated protein FlgK [Fimbriimonadaceae bacterium]
MPGTFHGINIASSALRAFQRAMETTGHNLANVNTRGYSRQRVDNVAFEPMALWSGRMFSLGTGVQIESITRAREMFLENRFQGASGDVNRYNTYAQGLQQLESVYREPDAGISSAMNQMFDAFSGLASNPNDPTARTTVRNSASLFAQRVRTAYSDMTEMHDQVTLGITETFRQINQMGEQIATLNEQIRAATVGGGSPNDLLDQRDLLIRDLSQLSNVRTSTQPDGTTNVFISNFPLVTSDHFRSFPTTYDAATMTVADGSTTYPVRGGVLMGQMQTLNRIAKSQAELDTLANTMRSQFNVLHHTGMDAAGNAGGDFFNDGQTGAINFDLDAAISSDPSKIFAGTTGYDGDGGLALAMSQLRAQKLTDLGDRTFSDFYSASVSGLANDIGQAKAQTETFGSILDQISAQADSISGVSIDEEMADLMRYQRSYQAAARVLTILDQTTEDIINMMAR